MALDLTAFFAEALSENEKFGLKIKGLENLSTDRHLTSDQQTEVLVALELLRRFFEDIAEIAARITSLKEKNYPIIPSFPESAAFLQAIADEVLATQAAAAVFVAQDSAAVSGDLLFQAPIGKV